MKFVKRIIVIALVIAIVYGISFIGWKPTSKWEGQAQDIVFHSGFMGNARFVSAAPSERDGAYDSKSLVFDIDGLPKKRVAVTCTQARDNLIMGGKITCGKPVVIFVEIIRTPPPAAKPAAPAPKAAPAHHTHATKSPAHE